MKTTPWYPGTVKPVRVGVYERWYPLSNEAFFSFWTGKFWRAGTKNINATFYERESDFQNFKWRGLTEKAR